MCRKVKQSQDNFRHSLSRSLTVRNCCFIRGTGGFSIRIVELKMCKKGPRTWWRRPERIAMPRNLWAQETWKNERDTYGSSKNVSESSSGLAFVANRFVYFLAFSQYPS
jgi:hypothetical protein